MNKHDGTASVKSLSSRRGIAIAGVSVCFIAATLYFLSIRSASTHFVTFFDQKREREYRKFEMEMKPEFKGATAKSDEERKTCCPQLLESSNPLEMQHCAFELKEKYAFCILFNGLKRSILAVKSCFHHDSLAEEIRSHLDLM